MTRLLALDLATNVGFCFGELGKTPLAWSSRLPSTGDDVGRFLHAYCLLLETVCDEQRPTHIAFEAPILHSGKTSLITARKLMSLAGDTERIAFARHIRCTEANGSQVTKFFTGRASYPGKDRAEKRDAKKSAVVNKCRSLGWPVSDDDAADAAAVFAYTECLLAPGARELDALFASVSRN